MSLFQFAIASVVDANTGYGLSRRDGHINYAEAERLGRSIRAKSIIALLKRIRQGVIGKLDELREYRAKQRNIKLLSQLDDHLLDDIGYTRGDIIAVQFGQIDMQQLEAHRIANLGVKPVILHNVKLHNEYQANQAADSRSASNEAIFSRAKCA